MSILTFPIAQKDLFVDVLVNVEASLLLSSVGNSYLPIVAKGQIDTASTMTGVSMSILHQLALAPVGLPQSTMGIAGSVMVDMYMVSLHIRNAGSPQLPMFTFPTLLAMGLPSGTSFDVLIGMDVLMGCKLIVDGPLRKFSLEF